MRCVLNSGGMDSYLTWWLYEHKYGERVNNVFVDIGHAYAAKERTALAAINAMQPNFHYVVAKGPPIGGLETPSGIIPNRNAELILAASAEGYSKIMMGVLHGEINSDKSPEFMSAMQTVLDISWRAQYWNATARVHRIWSPIREYTKTELVAHYRQAGGRLEPLLATVSCYSLNPGHCGRCPSCFKRWVALTNNYIAQAWGTHPVIGEAADTARTKISAGAYDKRRADEISRAFATFTRNS